MSVLGQRSAATPQALVVGRLLMIVSSVTIRGSGLGTQVLCLKKYVFKNHSQMELVSQRILPLLIAPKSVLL